MGGAGQATALDLTQLLDLFVQVTVLLPLVTLFVSNVAMYLHPRSHMYKASINQPLVYRDEMRRFAARSALVAAAFKQWDEDGSGGIELTELAQIFASAGIDPVLSKKIAVAIFDDDQLHLDAVRLNNLEHL